MISLRNLPRCLFVLACAGFAGLPTAQGADKIGVLLKGRSAFWTSMEKGAIDAARKSGAEVVVKAPPSEGDVSVQIQLLNAMAAQGFSAIVISPANKDALSAPVAALAARGVKVVVLESPLAGEAGKIFVGTDHQMAGEAAGSLLATLVGDADEVSFLNSAQTNTATLTREKGALAKFRAAHPKSVVHADIYASAEAGAELEKARLLLTQYPGTKAIFSSGTLGTMAMLKALQEKKLAGTIKLVGFGFNLNPEIAAALAEGKMHGWIAWQPRELGAKGVETALAVVKGEKVPAFVNTDFVVVTPQNLKDEKVQALLAL
jgi:ribose transport system substrate-binding protein